MLWRDGFDWDPLREGRVRHDDVDGPLLGGNGLAQAIKIIEVCGVALDNRHMLADEGSGLLKFGLSSSHDEDIGPLLDEALGYGSSDACAAACDDGYFFV